MTTAAVNPGGAATLLSLSSQSSVLETPVMQVANGEAPPSDFVVLSDTAREAHAAGGLLDAAGFSFSIPEPAKDTPAPFQNLVAAVQYRQVQSFLQTGTTSFSPP